MTNEEILNTFASKMLSAVEGIEAFGKEQIPDYIEQVLIYNFYESVFFVSSWLVVMVAAVAIVFFALKKHKEEIISNKDLPYSQTTNVWEMASWFINIFSAIIIVIGVGVSVGLLAKCIKIKVAPKVYIVDYLRHTIK